MNVRQHPRGQRGAAALVVTALLLFAMLLVVAAANRGIVVEAQSSANQYRSTQAFEAAEAGLEWTLAKLNDDARLGDDCLPSDAAGALSFRERHLRYDTTLGSLVPTRWNDDGTPKTLQAACRHDDTGWRCSCPSAGAPALAAAAGASTAPSFVVELSQSSQPGIIVAVANACTASNAVCGAASGTDREASARVEVAFGLVPALRAAPLAALTARGDVDAGDAALGLHFSDGETGAIAIDAGGHVAGSAIRLIAPAGSPLAASIASGDEAFAGLDGEHFFARWFGMSKAAWTAQPAVARIVCGDGCGNAVVAAVALGRRTISVQGDLEVDGPATLGTPERPIVLIVSGSLQLRGAVNVTGLVYASAIRWSDAPADAAIAGAAVTENNYSGDAAADIVHDEATLSRLHGSQGTFARVAGSWKDF
jgi:Tfp pilus assembly protein PilX